MTSLTNLRGVDVSDILRQLPDIEPLNTNPANEREDVLFMTALGFEERCTWIAELLSEGSKYKATWGVYFEFSTNQNDNLINRSRLTKAINSFAMHVQSMPCDSAEFPTQLRRFISDISAQIELRGVTFDISACSSKLLVTALSVLLEYDLELRLVYSEAGLYHPTKDEYFSDPKKWTTDEGLGIARGVSSVTPSPDHPGNRRDLLPEAIIVFPTFKPERARAIIASIDPSLILRPSDRVTWLLGEPHLKTDEWRMNAQKTINKIPTSAKTYVVSTFNYKKSIEFLERIYEHLDYRYHVNIAPLGSKMQSVGVVLFWYIRRDVSIVFASPREYNAAQYSEGCKAVWCIEFMDLAKIRRLLDTVGELRTAE